MPKCLVGVLAILLAVSQGVRAESQPTAEANCHWGVCLSDKEMVVGGIVVTSSAVATALTVSPYGAQQAGELAAVFLLSSVLSTAASFAVVGAVVYYYGPRLWQHISDRAQVPEPAWRQYLDGFQQEVGGWPDEVEGMMSAYRQIISEQTEPASRER